MDTRSLKQQFFHYLIPSVASLVSLSLYILADTFFVANGVGSVGLAALNIVIPAYSVITATAMMIGAGGGVLVAVSRGSGNPGRAQKTFQCALTLALLVGAVYTAVGLLFVEDIVLLLGASEQSAPDAITYIRVIFAFSTAFLLNTTLGALVRNDGNPRLAMAAMMTNSGANVVLDYIFVMVLDWGMWGAAFATGLAAASGILLLSLHWIRGRASLFLRRALPDFRLTGAILRGGIANFITEMGNGLVILLFNFTLLSLAGDMGVAAYGIVANISLVISYVFVGMGQGMQPVISYQYGQGREDNCRRVWRLALLLAAVLGTLFTAVGLLFPVPLTALFNSEGDPLLAELTVQAIRLYFFCFLGMGINICAASYFQSMLRARTAMVISMLRACVLVVAGVMVMPRLWGLTGVWLIAPLAELVTLVVSLGAMKLPGRKKTPARGTPEPDFPSREQL